MLSFLSVARPNSFAPLPASKIDSETACGSRRTKPSSKVRTNRNRTSRWPSTRDATTAFSTSTQSQNLTRVTGSASLRKVATSSASSRFSGPSNRTGRRRWSFCSITTQLKWRHNAARTPFWIVRRITSRSFQDNDRPADGSLPADSHSLLLDSTWFLLMQNNLKIWQLTWFDWRQAGVTRNLFDFGWIKSRVQNKKCCKKCINI